jgi:hypothetical protein
MKQAATVVLVASCYASQETRGRADIAENANIGCAPANVVRTPGATDPTVMAPAAARGIDPDLTIVSRDVMDRRAQPWGKTAAVGTPLDARGAS